MICALCAGDTQSSPCSACGSSPYLDGRYRLEERLESTAASSLFRAVEIMNRQRTALREFPIHGSITDGLQADLNTAFARVSGVEHSGAVKHLDGFASGKHSDVSWWIVRAWVDGTPLRERIERGPSSEDEVLTFLGELLAVVGAFHKIGLPHGAIGPDTVIQRSDGRLMVLEPSVFGDVLLAAGVGGDDTVPANAAPEESRHGPSVLADLYRCGALAASLLSGQDARYLQRHAEGIRWDAKGSVSPALSAVIDELTREDPSRRSGSAAEALRALQNAKKNPVSLVGIASSWEEYTPDLTPPPAPKRPLPMEEAETVEDLDKVALGLVRVLDSVNDPAEDTAIQLPPPIPVGTLSSGALPIGLPGPPPPQDSGRGWLLGLGCGGLLLLSLIGGIGIGATVALNQPSGTEQAPADPEPYVPPPTPVPVAPEPVEPDPTPPPAPVLQVGPEDSNNGFIRVRCERPVMVAIDGRVVDRTPLDFELAPGEYQLTVTRRSEPGWVGRRTIEVRAGEVLDIHFDL